MNFLACDLGGTKVLIAIYEDVNKDSPPKLIAKERYLSAKWESIYSITKDFLENKCKNKYFPKIACYGIAGPVEKNSAKITNLNWEISELKLKNYFKFEKVELINDFAVLIYGIPFLKSDQFKTLQNHTNKNNNFEGYHAVVGAGTGLGISRGIISKTKILVLPSEGGHIEYAPRTDEEWELKQWLKNNLNVDRVSYERIISGEGLSNIAKWKFSKEDIRNHNFNKYTLAEDKSNTNEKDLAGQICQLAEEGDPLMLEIEKLWFDAYSSFIGDLAIHELCFGGLWISGGTAPKHFKKFISDSFLKQFSNKGRLKDIVKTIPIRIILDEEFGLHSAACRAKSLLSIQ